MDDENNIVFHDETPQESLVKGEKNKLGIISFGLVILSIILQFTNNTVVTIIGDLSLLLAFILSIVALSQIKKKEQEGKVFAILGLVGSIIVFLVSIIIVIVAMGNMNEQDKNDLLFCPNSSDCVDNGDGSSSCVYMGDGKTVTCTTKTLKKNQFK